MDKYLLVEFRSLNIPVYIAHFIEHYLCDALSNSNEHVKGVTSYDFMMIYDVDNFSNIENNSKIFERQKKIILKEILERKSINNENLIRKNFLEHTEYLEDVVGNYNDIFHFKYSDFTKYLNLVLVNINKYIKQVKTQEEYDLNIIEHGNWLIIQSKGYDDININFLLFLKYIISVNLDTSYINIYKKEMLLCLYCKKNEFVNMMNNIEYNDYINFIDYINNYLENQVIYSIISRENSMLFKDFIIEINKFMINFDSSFFIDLSSKITSIRVPMISNEYFIDINYIKKNYSIRNYRIEGMNVIFECNCENIFKLKSNFYKLDKPLFKSIEEKVKFNFLILMRKSGIIFTDAKILSQTSEKNFVIFDHEYYIPGSLNISKLEEESKAKNYLFFKVPMNLNEFLLLHEAIIYKNDDFTSFERYLRNKGLSYSLYQSFFIYESNIYMYLYVPNLKINLVNYHFDIWISLILNNYNHVFNIIEEINNNNKVRDFERVRYYSINSFHKDKFRELLENIVIRN